MIVNVVEIFTEYLSIILCMHKIAKKKVVLDRYFWMFFLLDLSSILLAHKYREEHGWLMILVYVNFFVYAKMRLCKKWSETVKVFGIMLILIPSMQLVMYYFMKLIARTTNISYNNMLIGLEGNSLICILLILCKKEYILIVVKGIVKSKSIIVLFIFCVFFSYLLFIYKKLEFVQDVIVLQIITSIIGMGIISILWINAENEKKITARELQLYELYNKTFEEAIIAIKARQHEFDNHINAIKCMQLTINNHQELIKVQNDYCDKILLENSMNKILKLHTEPILMGLLYSKLIYAQEQGINVIHEIHSIDLKKRINLNLIVEILGILLDNAIETLIDKKDEKILIVKILKEKQKGFSIEVANVSRKYKNTEIEKFCICGYSTKGEGRGLGLARVKEIVKKTKADFVIENVSYNSKNFLSFKIKFMF